jgi:hypothetical protein
VQIPQGIAIFDPREKNNIKKFELRNLATRGFGSTRMTKWESEMPPKVVSAILLLTHRVIHQFGFIGVRFIFLSETLFASKTHPNFSDAGIFHFPLNNRGVE